MRTTKIEWSDGTFNIVWGCQKVSPGCEHCYALTLAKRHGHDVWGPAKTTARRVLSDAYWRDPLKWNRDALRDGTRPRIFCSSMADVGEDHPTTREQLRRLWPLMKQTPALEWLLLTKRPENMVALLPDDWNGGYENVRFGTSVELQMYASKRLDALFEIPTRLSYFVSAEPLLGRLDLSPWLEQHWFRLRQGDTPRIGQVIVGGESGIDARPCHPAWVQSLRDQCATAGISFLFKQWGAYAPTTERFDRTTVGHAKRFKYGMVFVRVDGSVNDPGRGRVNIGSRKAFDPIDQGHLGWVAMQRRSKADNGRVLDGVEWSEMPHDRLLACVD